MEQFCQYNLVKWIRIASVKVGQFVNEERFNSIGFDSIGNSNYHSDVFNHGTY